MEEDLRSSGAGLRGFKSHPRYHYVQNNGGWSGDVSIFLVLSLFLKILVPSKSITYSNPASARMQMSFSVLAIKM